MKEFQISDSTYSVLIRLASKQSKTDFALYYYKKLIEKKEYAKMENFLLILNSLLESLVRNERLDKALTIFDFHSSQFPPQSDIITFSTIIKGLCKY